MKYKDLNELKVLQNINAYSIGLMCNVLNNNFNKGLIDEETLRKSFDHLDDLIEKAKPSQFVRKDDILGSFEYFDIKEAISKGLDVSKLVKKQVMIKRKDGKVYMAYRYVDPNTGESVKTGKESGKYAVFGDDDVANLEAIVNSDAKNSEKIRDLVGMGVYDKKTIISLTGASPAQAYTELKALDLIGEVKEPKTNDSGENMSAHDGGFPPAGLSDMSEKKVKQIMQQVRSNKREEEGLSYKDFWKSYENTLEGVILDGYPKSLIAYGTGGLGKTYTLDQMKEKLQIREYDEEINHSPHEYDSVTIKGTTGIRDMWSIVTKNRDKLIVFDDCDSMWAQGKDEQQNILKGMLDTSGDGTVRYGNAGKDEDGNQMPKQIRFTGQVIFISNLERSAFPQPLISSRCGAIDLTMTKDETMEKLGDIKDKMKIKGKSDIELEISPESRQAAYEFFEKNKNVLDIGQINARTFAQVAQIHNRFTKQGDLSGFEKEALIRMNLV